MTTTRSVVLERELPHPPEKIWRALTEGALIKQWLMDNDFQPIAGHAFKLRATPMPQWDGIIDCEVLVVEPNTRLAYTWVTFGLETTVLFTLAPTATGTLLRVEQSGFPADREANYKGATYGWQKFLTDLETVTASLV